MLSIRFASHPAGPVTEDRQAVLEVRRILARLSRRDLMRGALAVSVITSTVGPLAIASAPEMLMLVPSRESSYSMSSLSYLSSMSFCTFI